MQFRNLVYCFGFLVLANGCTVHRVSRFDTPCVEVPDAYLGKSGDDPVIEKWWQEFNQPQLNRLMEIALVQNLDIKQAWSRLDQARASACIVASELYPQIDLIASGKYKKEVDQRGEGSDKSSYTYLISPTLAYEVDLWKKIDSRVNAAEFNVCTSVEDLEATAVVLSGAVVDLWLTIQEQKALLKLIHHQIEVSQTLLDLVELRFSIGDSSALDVYQQRLQFEETRSQVFPVEALLKTSNYQLHVLLGEPPEDFPEIEPNIINIELPPFPELGNPAELLVRRPDLRAAHYSVIAADYEVAAAIADLYPRLTLPAFAEFKTTDISNFFQQQLYEATARFFQPIFDGFRRQCEVKRRQAIVKERLDSFGRRFLVALREVEDAVVNEHYEKELIAQLQLEVDIARLNLEEAHRRYATGLNDYLTVIAAIQSLQRLERRVISEHRRLLINRSQLYRSLGIPCLVGCSNGECSETVDGEEFTFEEQGV